MPPALPADSPLLASTIIDRPVVQSPVAMQANRSFYWREGNVHMLLIERDVAVVAGAYGFRADRAVVRIESSNSPDGPVRHVAFYLDDARAVHGVGATQAQAPHLLVTVNTTGYIELATDLLKQQQHKRDPLVVRAQDRFKSSLASIRNAPVHRVVSTTIIRQPHATQSRGGGTEPYDPTGVAAGGHATPLGMASTAAQLAAVATQDASPTEADAIHIDATEATAAQSPARILPATGTVSLTFGRMVIQSDPNRNEVVAVLMGNVGVMFSDPVTGANMSLTAERAVVFLDREKAPDSVFTRIDAGSVVGVYLEDNAIATNGEYTVRAPRVFYDPRLNKAVILDAVFHTWNARQHVPLYVRADKIMQESLDVWKAHRALLTTSEFAEPHFSIAADQITLTRKADAEGDSYHYVASKPKLRWGNASVFAWPSLSGKAQEIPLRSIDLDVSQNAGMRIRTRWDVFSLIGREKPEGTDLTARIDYQGEHGPGLGADLFYELPQMFGSFSAYALLYDQGEDEIGGRNKITHDGDTRGFARWQHRQHLDDNWEVSLEAGYASDETFLEAFFPGHADATKQYETSLYLKKQQDDWALTFLLKYDVNDFTTQTTTLQSTGYTVDKLPELAFHKIGTSLWDDRLTWFSENSASYMRIRAGKDSPSDRGFTPAQSLLLFGMPNTTTFDAARAAAGLDDGFVLRGDSRHELQAPLKLGTLDVTPYLAGRVTAYSDDFQAFRGESENVRLWGAAGVRLHTEFSKTWDMIDSRMLDIHRLRHLVEPNADIMLAGANLNPEDLPVYDPSVEDIREGFVARLGLRNTLQTQRGGPGRWRSVDWLVVNTDFIMSSDDGQIAGDLPRYFSYRPEYTRGGDHFHTDVAWMISDTLAFAADMDYDFENSQVAQWRAGLTMQHTPMFTSFVDYAEIQPLDSRLLRYGFTYQFTRKYSLGFSHTIDLAGTQGRHMNLTLARELPRWRLLMFFEHDELDDDTTIGVVLIPLGVGQSRYTRPLYQQYY